MYLMWHLLFSKPWSLLPKMRSARLSVSHPLISVYWTLYPHSSFIIDLISSCHLSTGLLLKALSMMLSKKQLSPSLIKTASLSRDELNYRLVSDLCFLSKFARRVVTKQLMSLINNNNPHQLAYKPRNAIETALLSIKNKCHLSLTCGESTTLVLFYLLTASEFIVFGCKAQH